MLSIPVKTTGHAEIVKPAFRYINTKYKKGQAKAHFKPLEGIADLRKDVQLRLDRGDISEATKDVLIKYYGQVLVLDSRFPMHEKELRIEFTWSDAFKPKQRTTLGNVIIEKAALLFNIGAVYSNLACNESMDTDDGLKKGCHYFQTAAGCFQTAKELVTVHPLTVPTNDISLDGLQFCFALMMAQAQECLVEKVIKANKMKDPLVAKLCSQAVDFYSRAYGLSKGEQLVKHVDKSFQGYTKMKMCYFKALAHYRLSIGEGAKKAYGMELSHLEVAAENLKDAKRIASKLVNTQSNVDKLYSIVVSKYDECKADNDQIYHEEVFPESEMKPIEKKTTIKPIQMTDPSALPDFEDKFQSLIPTEVHGSIKKYVERRDALVLGATNKAAELENQVVTVLGELGLPDSISALESGGEMPNSIRGRVDNVRRDGGLDQLMDLLRTIEEISAVDNQELDKAQAVLQQEEAEDNNLRRQYGSRWQRQPSHIANGQLLNEISIYRNKVSQANKSDQVLKADIDRCKNILSTFNSDETLLQPLASMQIQAQAPNAAIVNTLKELLGQLDQLKGLREGLVGELRGIAQSDDITDKIVQTNLVGHEKLFKEELQKYDGHIKGIDENAAAQMRAIEKLRKTNDEFMRSRPKEKTDAEKYFGNVKEAADLFEKVKTELGQGIHFYTKLQEHLHRLGQKCSDYAFARQTEKQQLLQALGGGAPRGPPQYQQVGGQPRGPQQQPFQQPQQQYQQPGMRPGMQQPGQQQYMQPGPQYSQQQNPGMYVPQPGMQQPGQQQYMQQGTPPQGYQNLPPKPRR